MKKDNQSPYARRPYTDQKGRWNVPLHAYAMEYLGSKRVQEQFAKDCGTSYGNIQQVMYGNRSLKIELAIEISKASGSKASFLDTMPEIDWDYVQREIRRYKRANKQEKLALA
jgi:DNA-binding transcriptional regulator YdaS (Cro superfamily)